MLLFSSRIVIPQCLQQKTLENIHQGHQGIERCLQRIRSSVWRPGITSQLKQVVEHCHILLPEYPWQVVGRDLFEKDDNHRLLLVDYFSKYPEVTKLSATTSLTVISVFQTIVCSDKGPQYSSHEFAVFADSYGFQHCTSSPHFPQNTGQAERTVQTVKRLMSSSSDLVVIQGNTTSMVRT